MAAPADPRPPLAESLIAATLGGTWLLYALGGLYLAGPALGWVLVLLVLRNWYLGPVLPQIEQLPAIPGFVWAWIGGMLAMLLVLLAGHANFDLGTAQTIKSAIGWAKGWALLALFILAGYALPIKLETISRATCKVGKYTLFLLPLFMVAPFIGLPGNLFVSPLKFLGGSTDQYFAVILYTIEPGVGTPRWQFFAPWSPAAGFVGVLHFLLAREERSAAWRWTGYAASLALILLSQSRLALVALVAVLAVSFIAGRLKRPSTWLAFIPLVLMIGWGAPQLLELAQQAVSDFSSARADSSRVRAALGRIAVERWQNEAFWFGHGIVERGPHLVEYMPIGSHHSWYGLLFVKGILGALALAIPMGWTLIRSAIAAINGREGRLALSIILVFWLFSFGENLEMLSYLTWPGLVALGAALRPKVQSEDS